jgi:hypothetical protein
MSKFTNAEKAQEALREVAMREHVYARMAAGKPIKPADQRRIEMMREIAAEYGALAEKERLL